MHVQISDAKVFADLLSILALVLCLTYNFSTCVQQNLNIGTIHSRSIHHISNTLRPVEIASSLCMYEKNEMYLFIPGMSYNQLYYTVIVTQLYT